MGKKFIAALVIIYIIAVLWTTRSADASVTAYINKTTWVYARPSTNAARVRVARGTKVEVLAVRSSWARVKRSHYLGYIPTKFLSRKPIATPTPRPTSKTTPRPTATPRPTPRPTATPKPGEPVWKSKVEKVDWFKGGSSILRRGGYAQIYDIDSKQTVRIKRKGGTSHADVEPATKADTEKLKRIAGGSFSWKSHAVVLIVKGRYIAAAINTKPHGDQTIKDNDFPGQFCLHLTNSRTHETDRVNEDHQASIDRAYRWAHP